MMIVYGKFSIWERALPIFLLPYIRRKASLNLTTYLSYRENGLRFSELFRKGRDLTPPKRSQRFVTIVQF